MADKKAERIQTSILNGVEKKALVWLAERQPKWVVSDTLTFIGTLGAIMIGAGYMKEENGRLFFTPKGFLLSNSILARIL